MNTLFKFPNHYRRTSFSDEATSKQNKRKKRNIARHLFTILCYIVFTTRRKYITLSLNTNENILGRANPKQFPLYLCIYLYAKFLKQAQSFTKAYRKVKKRACSKKNELTLSRSKTKSKQKEF